MKQPQSTIRGQVAMDSIIHSNGWRGYNGLLDMGYKKHFRSPGAEKTTLFDAVSGLSTVESGEIRLAGCRVNKLPAWMRSRKRLRALPSRWHTLPSLNPRETLRLAGMPDRVEALGPLTGCTCDSLSGCERQKLALASMATGQVTLYDEPCLALDADTLSKSSDQAGYHPARRV